MLKRTSAFCYNKRNARLNRLAREAMMRGDRTHASALFVESDEVRAKNLDRHEKHIFGRPSRYIPAPPRGMLWHEGQLKPRWKVGKGVSA